MKNIRKTPRKSETIKIDSEVLKLARDVAKKNRRTVKTTIEMAIESAMKQEG